jgi:hypothetical protein
VVTVADYEPPAGLVEFDTELIDVDGDLGLQRRSEHLLGPPKAKEVIDDAVSPAA